MLNGFLTRLGPDRYNKTMDMWHQKTRVGSGGRIELVLPELKDGEQVDVVVRRENGQGPHADNVPPRFGFAEGQIRMSDNFDAPLDDFKEYS